VKSRIQYILQRVLGLQRYLNLFAWYKIKTLRSDENENDFFHFLQLTPKDKVALDIGANIGIMSYYMSRHIESELYSFEPIPNNLNTLGWVKRRFGLTNMHVEDCALGNTAGEIEMVLPVIDNVKKQGLSHVVTDEITEFNEGVKFKTQCYRLDDLKQINGSTVGAIKIDVENFEYQVFLGATELLKRDHPIVYCELWDNQNRYNCFDHLRSLGYTVKVLVGNQLELYDENDHDTQNFFFVYE
jgi:FkbM family methyltransferase